ncbi:MAG: DALR domain-containing protein [Bacteroidia bacterium]
MPLRPDTRAVAVNPAFEENLTSFAADVTAAMNDDLNTARVIARMFDTLPVINQLFKDKAAGFAVNPDTFNSFRQFFLNVFTDWLGMSVEGGEDNQAKDTIDGLMGVILQLRGQARKDKNWAVSDLIRDELAKVKIKLEDTKEGTDWYYEQ